jgi:hypothetical protein
LHAALLRAGCSLHAWLVGVTRMLERPHSPNHSFQPTRYSALRALTLAAELRR